jgi:hypothetical protein
LERILLLSDLHIGSLYGLMPAGFEVEDPRNGDPVKFIQNRTQKALWNHWLKMCRLADGVSAIILNGDLCDGPQRKSLGLYTWTSNMKFQAEAAIHAISFLPDAPKFYTQGSLYHAVEDRPIEQYIAERTGGIYGDDLLIEAADLRVHASHFINVSKSTWQYRSTPLARDLLLMALHDAEDKYGKVDLVHRGHAHYFVEVNFKSQMGVISPAWQTRNPFAVKIGLVSPPDIGYLFVENHGPGKIMIDKSGVTHIGRPSRVVRA